MQSLKEMAQQVQAAPDQQVSLTDPDARSMATSGRGTGVVGYNVQTAVDVEHHLIVAPGRGGRYPVVTGCIRPIPAWEIASGRRPSPRKAPGGPVRRATG
jgi:hypothetical protein